MARSGAMVDAERFLELTQRLRTIRERVDAARASAEQKSRWQRRLIAVTDAAKRDLGSGEAQLSRFEAELDRQIKS